MTALRHLLPAVLVLGCAEDQWEEEYDFEWLGEYVTVYGYDRDASLACGESLVVTDAYVETLLAFHESTVAVHIDYRWMSVDFWARHANYEDVTGYTIEAEVFSIPIAHRHEIAHAVSHFVHEGTCTPVLEEGLAVILDDADPSFDDYDMWSLAIRDLLVFRGVPTPREYLRSGHFVAFLLEAYGVDGFHALCRTALRDGAPTLAAWNAATTSALGLALDQVLTAYAEYPQCNQHQFRARLSDCGGEPDVVVNSTEPTIFSFRLACDEPDVVGDADGRMMLVRRVHVPEPGVYSVVVDDGGEIGSRAVIAIHEQCTICSALPLSAAVADVDLAIEGGPPCAWIESPTECGDHQLADNHVFVFFLDGDLDRDVEVRIYPKAIGG